MEGGVKTLLLGGSTKKNRNKKLSAAGRGVSGRRSKDFIIGRGHKKQFSVGGRGVSGKRSEDFIAEGEHKIFSAGGTGWVEGGVKTLLPGGSTKNVQLPVRGGWVCER